MSGEFDSMIRPTDVPAGLWADIKQRDASFVMPGHHCHSCYELFFVMSGTCRFIIGENMVDLQAGDGIMITPYRLHFTRYLFDVCRRVAVFFREEDIDLRTRSRMSMPDFFADIRIFRTPEEHREEMIQLYERITRESERKDSYREALLSIQLQELLMQISRFCEVVTEVPAELHSTDESLVAVAHFINEHYMDSISTADIASASGFSPNYLSRKFRQLAGVGLHEYLAFVRLQHAAAQLLETQDPVTQIALRCGFSSSNYFKDAFKKKYGITPRSYRKCKGR